MAEWSSSGFARRVVVLDRAGTAPRYAGFEYRWTPRQSSADSRTQRILLEEICRAEQADVFVSTYYTHPLRCPSLLYVHDMTPEVLGYDLSQPTWREKKRAIRRASAYVCVSRNTADDLLRLYPAEREKPLVVVPNGLDPAFAPASPEEVTRLVGLLELPRHYFLFIGLRVGYKNAKLMFEAAQEFRDRDDMGFLCVGGGPHLEAEHRRSLADAMPVTMVSLTDDELRAAYGGAAALLYVSKYEGFGLPILEAMACGCPVITCDNSSQKEVAGDAAIYVDDSDPAQLASAMRDVLNPERRAELVERGLRRTERADWADKAAAVEAALRQCAERALATGDATGGPSASVGKHTEVIRGRSGS